MDETQVYNMHAFRSSNCPHSFHAFVCVCETDNPQEKKVSKSLFYRISFQGTEDKPY